MSKLTNKGMEEKSKKIKPKRSLFHKIVNVFIYTVLTIFVIFLLILGFSQTSTFREMLRTKLIEIANQELNGKVYVERIDGTILSSIILHNTNITMEGDTLFKSETIELKTSPLKILFKIIYLRKFELRNAQLSLTRDENGELNITRLFPAAEDTDEASSPFPFKIQVADFKLTNVDFHFRNNGVTQLLDYDYFNLDDLSINKINLAFSAFADIANNSYSLDLVDFNFTSNIQQFGLKKLSGDFLVNDEGIGIKDLFLETEKSSLMLNGAVSNFNLFDTSGVNLNSARINSRLIVSNFNFNDLKIFTPSSDILRGDATFDLRLSGTLNNLVFPNLEVAFNNTHLGVKGQLNNLLEPDQLYIKADFFDTYIDQNDINNLLPSLKLPVYNEYGLLRFDSLSYTGKLLDFKSNFHLTTDKGELLGIAALNLEKEEMEYDLNFETKNFDAGTFTEFPLQLNMKGSIVGSGTAISTLKTNFILNAENSLLGSKLINQFNIKAAAENKTINYDINLISDAGDIDLTGMIDFTNQNSPMYDINGSILNLNLANVFQDSTQKSNLNFYVNASGEKIDLDSTNLFLSLIVSNSTYAGKTIDSTRAIVDLRNEVDGTRIINLISDIADITISGKYELLPTISYLVDESTYLTKAFSDKVDQIFPEQLQFNKSLILVNPPYFPNNNKKVESFNLSYFVDFKDFYLASLFLGDSQLELDGTLDGIISNKDSRLNISSTTHLDYLKYWGNDDVFFLSDMNANLDIAKPNNDSQIEAFDIKSEVYLRRIFLGSDFYDLKSNLNLKEGKADISFDGTLEDYSRINIDGNINLIGSNFILELDTLIGSYQDFIVQNDGVINISYNESKFFFNTFNLKRPISGELNLSGFVSIDGENDIKIKLNNFRAADLGRNIAGLNDIPDAVINLEAQITGILDKPVISSSLSLDSLNYKEKNFGSITAALDYQSKNLRTLINFSELDSATSTTGIKISGNFPIDLGLNTNEERLGDNSSVDFQVQAKNFDIDIFSTIIPQVKKISGKLNAELKVEGTLGSLKPTGFIQLDNGYFIPSANNLEYNASLNILMEEDNVRFEKLSIRNIDQTEDGGEISGTGLIILGADGIEDINIKLNGKLKILGEESKYVSPSVFGDLVIATHETIELKREGTRMYLSAPIDVQKADLKFTLTQSAYENSSAKFNYVFTKYSNQLVNQSPDFDSLISLANFRSKTLVRRASKPSYFDYKISINVEDEAKVIFVLSKKLNQDLTAILGGNFEYEHTGGSTIARGELNLLQGSQLQFFKSFEAAGTIKFENDIANPYLDVTASYRDFYYPADSSSSGSEIPIAVKIKLKGLLSELNKNFISDKENIAVYSTNYNIDNDLPDANRDASDAVMFILTGNFTDGVSQQDRNAAASTATSLAGSLFSGLLNKQFGDYVRSLQLRQVGATTKFSLMGKAGNFRYEIGGSTDVFQDLSQASVKIEYPFYKNFVIRIERKEAISQTTVASEMINELGLKYRFEF